MNQIYLDHAATTPVHPDVLQVMLPYFTEYFGNPSSIHGYGRKARSAIGQARERIAACINCTPDEIIFTSGGTESNHLAIKGTIEKMSSLFSNVHIITTQIEHHAVLMPLKQLMNQGIEVTFVPVDKNGIVNVDEIKQAIRENTVLISVMYVNNEVGTIQPIQEIAQIAKTLGIRMHVDAVQALGKCKIDCADMGIDMMSFSAHKCNGPKGIGALYLSKKTLLSPLFVGGSQEKKRRAGTENVAGIIGFAEAMERATSKLNSFSLHMNELSKVMLAEIANQFSTQDIVIHGHPSLKLPHIWNISFLGMQAETLLMNLDLENIAISSGAACSSGSVEISHVLKAMNVSEEIAKSAIRISFGESNTKEQLVYTIQKISQIVKRVKKIKK
jgi:cysteine desulfurase